MVVQYATGTSSKSLLKRDVIAHGKTIRFEMVVLPTFDSNFIQVSNIFRTVVLIGDTVKKN